MIAENPFPAAPNSGRYLPIGSIEAARIRLLDTLTRGDGLGLVIGGAGTGKSLLCAVLAEQLRETHDVVLLAETQVCTRKALLQHILHHLGMGYLDRSEGELRLTLIDRATSGSSTSRQGLVIVVDEAQGLAGRLLEELRLMSGIVRNGNPRVHLVLSGTLSLDDRLSHPRLEALNQRIAARCYLHPLTHHDTAQYIRSSLLRAGGAADLIDDEAIRSIFFAADGIPRLINQTMSRALALATAEKASRLTARLIDQAWADLQQLPGPNVEYTTSAVASGSLLDLECGTPGGKTSMIEFGPLGNLDDLDFEDEDKATARDPMAETVDYEPPVSIPQQRENEADTNDEFEQSQDETIDEQVESDVDPQIVQLSCGADREQFFGSQFSEEQVVPAFQSQLNDPPQYDSDTDSDNADIVDGQISSIGFLASGIEEAVACEVNLHDEIVAINREALVGSAIVPAATDDPTDGDRFRFDAQQESVNSEHFEPQVVDVMHCDFEADEHEPAASATSEATAASSSDELPEGDNLADDIHSSRERIEHDDITIRDDSDLLVIEEDVELESNFGLQFPSARTVHRDDQTELQDILQKMRDA